MFAKLFAALFAASVVLAAPIESNEKRIMHSGRATFYTVTGTGSACEYTVTDTDFIVALNKPQYTLHNGGNCGQYLTITNDNNGNVETAYVADECPECAEGSLDMSPALFSALNNGDMDAGVFPISWHFLKRD